MTNTFSFIYYGEATRVHTIFIYNEYNIIYKRRTLEPNTIGKYKGREILFLDILLYLNV